MKLLREIVSWVLVVAVLFLCCLAIGTLERIANRLENPPKLLSEPAFCACPAGFCRCLGNPCKCALTSKSCTAPGCQCHIHPAKPTPARELHFPLDPEHKLHPEAQPVLKSVVVSEPLDPMPGPVE